MKVGGMLVGASVGFGSAPNPASPHPTTNKAATANDPIASSPNRETRLFLNNNNGVCKCSDLVDGDVNHIASSECELGRRNGAGSSHHGSTVRD